MEVKSEGSPPKSSLTKYIKFQRISLHNDHTKPSLTDNWPSSMIGKYLAVCRQKHKLTSSWQLMKSRDQYARRQQQLSQHKTLIENKKKQYLERYRDAKNNVVSKSREQVKNMRDKKSQPRMSAYSENQYAKKLSEQCKERALKIRLDQGFNERFIEQRNKLEFDRKLMSAQDIKRRKKQLQNSLLKAKAEKHTLIAKQLAVKIHRQLGECNRIQNEVRKLSTSHSKEACAVPIESANKYLFKRIL